MKRIAYLKDTQLPSTIYAKKKKKKQVKNKVNKRNNSRAYNVLIMQRLIFNFQDISWNKKYFKI